VSDDTATHNVGDASHLMQSMLKGFTAQNDDMRFASPDIGSGKYSPEKTKTPFDAALAGPFTDEFAVAGSCATLLRRLARRAARAADHGVFDTSIRRLPPGLQNDPRRDYWRTPLGIGGCAPCRIH